MRRKQQGGYLQGRSHKDGGIAAVIGGSQPVELEGGEYIIKRSSVDKLGKDVLARINKEGRIPTMATGGETKVYRTITYGSGAGKTFKTKEDYQKYVSSGEREKDRTLYKKRSEQERNIAKENRERKKQKLQKRKRTVSVAKPKKEVKTAMTFDIDDEGKITGSTKQGKGVATKGKSLATFNIDDPGTKTEVKTEGTNTTETETEGAKPSLHGTQAQRKAYYDQKNWAYDDTIKGETKKTKVNKTEANKTDVKKSEDRPDWLDPESAKWKKQTDVKKSEDRPFKSQLGPSKTDALRRKQFELTKGGKKTKPQTILDSAKNKMKQEKIDREEVARSKAIAAEKEKGKKEAKRTKRNKKLKSKKWYLGKNVDRMKEMLAKRKDKKAENKKSSDEVARDLIREKKLKKSGVGLHFENGGYMPNAGIPVEPKFRQGMRMMGHGGEVSTNAKNASGGDPIAVHSHSGYKAGE